MSVNMPDPMNNTIRVDKRRVAQSKLHTEKSAPVATSSLLNRRWQLSLLIIVLALAGSLSWLHRPTSTPVDATMSAASMLRDYLGFKAVYPINHTKLVSPVPRQCQLRHLQLIARHGRRYPVDREMRQLTALAEELTEQRRPDWPDWLQQWQNRYPLDKVGELTPLGAEEMAALAARAVAKYGPWWHNHTLNGAAAQQARHAQSWYASSDGTRCIDSAQAYASVVSGQRLSTEQLHIRPRIIDRQLTIHRACPRWLHIDKNMTPANALMVSTLAADWPHIQAQLSAQLGYPITLQSFKVMVMACATELSMDEHDTRWCRWLLAASPLNNATVHAFQLYSYLEDVRIYYRSSFGRRWLNEQLACELLGALRDELQEAATTVQNSSRLRSQWRFRFTHSTVILLVLAQLRVHMAHPTLSMQRHFHTARLAPFAANLHIELLKCTEEEGEKKKKKKKKKGTAALYLRLLLNEQPITLPGCPQHPDHLCSLSQALSILTWRIGPCNYDKICHTTTSDT